MGLLDDAIREHLELKRRRGADTAEVARQEQEAFGPPRRGEFEPAAAAEAVAVEERPEPFFGTDGGHDADDHNHDDEAPTGLHAVDDLPRPQSEPPRPHGDPADELPSARHEPEPAPAAPTPAPPEAAGQATEAFDPDEVRAATRAPDLPPPAAPEPSAAPEPPEAEPEPTPAQRAPEDGEEEGEDGDVLEETPEFLQETPEHDRLWFEQRPPRDFDF
jgi:hypothetical protein